MAHATRLFVGNLPDNLNETALREAFSSYGDVTNFDLKSKPGIDDEKKKFAFITISASNFNIESCIKYFTKEEFQGTKLHVTRARESFLERLQREREQSNKNGIQQDNYLNREVNIVHKTYTANETPNFNKRKFIDESEETTFIKRKTKEIISDKFIAPVKNEKTVNTFHNDEKKQNSDKKRLESIKKKRQEFNEKKNIIKSGLISIDKKSNKKIVFSDTEESVENNVVLNGHKKDVKKANLFEDEPSDDDINFDIKEQFEGKKGQKVLDLQSRYKSDKRFVLDERFAEDSESDKDEPVEDETVDLEQADEKSKQLNILQDVFGITIKTRSNETTSKTKAKLGMLRFDPFHPEHAQYLAPVTVKESTKKSKAKKSKDNEFIEETQKPEPETDKVEVSKEQFYKISDTLKEVISQPTSFSLRSLFTKDNDQEEEKKPQQEMDYIPILTKKDSKVKNPMDPGKKNPFEYDSSESENEEEHQNNETVKESGIIQNDTKTVWREKLFFSLNDYRLKEGLLFFSKTNECNQPKERRELKSLMKKRIYNKERKNTMFQKKIGGRKKSVKRNFRKN